MERLVTCGKNGDVWKELDDTGDEEANVSCLVRGMRIRMKILVCVGWV